MSLQLHINEFNNQCRFIGRQQDSTVVASELGQLPLLLAEAISTQLQQHSPDAQQGIYCIRQLKLAVTLPRQQLSARLLGTLLAQQLGTALQAMLQQPQTYADYRYFPTEADYIAAFIRSLLQSGQAELWLFPQYHSLRHLPAVEATVQLLLPRFTLLAGISSALAAQQMLAALSGSINDIQARSLLQQWLGDNSLAPFSTAGLPLPLMQQLQQQLAGFDIQLAEGPPALGAITTLLHSLPGLTSKAPRSLLVVILQRQLLLHCRQQLPQLLNGTIGPAAANVSAGLKPALADLLHWAAQQPQRLQYIEQCLQHTVSPLATASSKAAADTLVAYNVVADNAVDGSALDDSTVKPQQFYSRQAALVLLLPVLLGLRLHQYYCAASLRLALLQALDPALAETAPPGWLTQLLPDNSCAAQDSPELPPLSRQGLTSSEQQQLAELTGTAQLAELLLRHFAGRLSGLQRSSCDYLRQQFLHGGGVITLDASHIHARLNAIALAIVLQMAGLADWCDTLPWLKKTLTIEVTA